MCFRVMTGWKDITVNITAPLTAQKIRFVTLVGMAAGLTAFDETSLGIILPTLRHEFQTTSGATHWVVNAYLLVMASLVAATGRLSDFVPADTLWRIGLALFAVMSVAAGFSPRIDWLIACRAIQGLGAALIFTSSVTLIGRVFADEERGRAFGLFSFGATLLIMIGPIAGGWLTDTLSWRWVFWVTVPPALLCLFGLKMPPITVPPPKDKPVLDLPGLATLVLAVAALTLYLMQGSFWGWLSPVMLCLPVMAVASGLAFFWIETRSSAPLIDLSLFRDRAVSASLLTLFMAQYRRVGTSIYLALFLRDGLGLSPLHAGLALVPTVAILPISTVLVGRYADRFGARIVMLTGIAVVGVCAAWIAVATEIRIYWYLFPALLLLSCFAPTMFGPSRKAMLHALPASHNAQLSGISVTAQMLGGTLSISVGSLLLTTSGVTWPVFLLMALTLAGLWLVVYRWLDRQPVRPPA